jgi:hypothetical protein
MVLAAPGPLLTPPPSSSPPKTPHRSYSAQTRSQDEVKNPPPKQYLPPQTRTRHRRAFRPHVPMLMRGDAPPTTRSPPHRSRRGPAKTRIASAEVETRIASAVVRALNRMIIASNVGNPLKTGAGAVSLGRESNNVDPLVSGFGQIYLTVKYI